MLQPSRRGSPSVTTVCGQPTTWPLPSLYHVSPQRKAPPEFPVSLAEWPVAIINAITQSRALVLIFSSHANQSRQVPREIERAVDKGIPIVCLRIEPVEPGESLEYFIGVVQWVDALTLRESSIAQVADAVRRLTTSLTPDKGRTDRHSGRPLSSFSSASDFAMPSS